MRDKIAFVGRSNVGKSSVIRLLTGKKVRVGRRPGTTLEPRFIPYSKHTVVDMPGFGLMRGVSRERQEVIKDFIVHYLEDSDEVMLAVQITDAKAFAEIAERWDERGQIPVEVEMFQFLDEIGLNPILVCNKMDNVPKGERDAVLKGIRRWLGLAEDESAHVMVPFSAKTREGLGSLKKLISQRVMMTSQSRASEK